MPQRSPVNLTHLFSFFSSFVVSFCPDSKTDPRWSATDASSCRQSSEPIGKFGFGRSARNSSHKRYHSHPPVPGCALCPNPVLGLDTTSRPLFRTKVLVLKHQIFFIHPFLSESFFLSILFYYDFCSLLNTSSQTRHPHTKFTFTRSPASVPR